MSASDVLHTIAKQFDDDPLRNDFLILAAQQVSADWFGNKYDLAVAYMTAHMMSLALPLRYSGETGAISSKKEGDLALAFANSSGGSGGSDDDLNQTHYGKSYIRLRDSCGFMVDVTSGFGIV